MGEDLSFILYMVGMFSLIITTIISKKRAKGSKSEAIKKTEVQTYKKREKREVTEETKIKLDKIAEIIKEKTKTVSYSISCEEGNDISIFESKFGGLPYWDLNMEYPLDNKGKKIVLLAQINFEKENFDDNRLPKKGILQFFISSDIMNGLEGSGYKVIYHENINENIKKEDIEKLNIPTSRTIDGDKEEYFPFEEEYKITFNKKEEFLGAAVNNFDDMVKKIVKEEFNEEITENIFDYFSYEEYDYLTKDLDTTGHKVLGYPYFTQMDPRSYKDEKTYETLLLQIDSEGKIMWGDCGVANFFINSKDLENKDFSDVFFTWDCC